ncbi:hypothetical protein [Cellulosimicrobium sp. 22601]|uniref:hypothetical protein n=1 Tax=unclassified Cellulosimicrobium TaxID=2624466 RepID=UPI003F85A88D
MMAQHEQKSSEPSGEAVEDQAFRKVFKSLRKVVRDSRNTGRWLLAIAAVLSVLVVSLLYLSTNSSIATIERHLNAQTDTFGVSALVFYMSVRATALAAFAGAVVYGLFNLGRAAFDQSTRFEKRYLASRLMHGMLERHDVGQETRKPLSTEEVLQILAEWSKSVDSAYTSVKFGKNIKGQTIYVGPNGFEWSEKDPPSAAKKDSTPEAK